jgi:hypothetical protein
MAGMRVRVAIGLAVLATAVGLVIDMSGSTRRTAGDDGMTRVGFFDTVPAGGQLCQASMVLPDDAASINVLIGTFGYPVPPIAVAFKNQAGRTVATGSLRAGVRVNPFGNSIPLRYPHGASVAGTLCLHPGGRHTIAFAGESLPNPQALATVNGTPQPGRVSVTYWRRGRESWWQLLGTLDQRFGLGKSTIFGDWTLPLLALAVLALWIAAVRFMVRELRS